MKIENLKVGMVIKNYKELCKILEVEEKKSGSKKYQLQSFERFFRYEKQGNKFIITEIFNDPLPVIDGRGKNPNSHGNNHIGQPVFKNDLEIIITDIIATEYQNKTTLDKNINIPKSYMFFNSCMVNKDYLNLYNIMEKVSKDEDIPLITIDNFYNTSRTKMTKNMERALNGLKNQGLLHWEYRLSVKTTQNQHRLATEQEINLIKTIEVKVLQDMGYKSMTEIWFTPKWKTFQKKKKELMRSELGLYYDYSSVYIVPSLQFETYMSDYEKVKQSKLDVNTNMIESTIKSAEKKYNKTVRKVTGTYMDKFHMEQENPYECTFAEKKYVSDIVKLTSMFIQRGKEDIDYILDLDDVEYLGTLENCMKTYFEKAGIK